MQALLLVTIALLVAFSASLNVRPVSGFISNLTVTPGSATAKSGTTVEVIGLLVSTTYSTCWGVCEATWFGVQGAAPYVDGSLTTTGCSVANYNDLWWSGTCSLTIFLRVNDGGVTPPGTYYPLFYVYTYTPASLTTTITLTVT
jgi:hypothetical protein